VLFISSYLEGSGYNKFLEIYNKGTATANLDDFAFPNTANGHPDGHEHWNAFTSGATLGPGQHYIIAHPDADAAILDKADQTHKYLSNGNDAYALVYGTESEYSIIDSIGKFGPDPGDGWDVCGVTSATKDHALLRKPTIEEGNHGLWDDSRGTTSDDCEWYVLQTTKFKLESFPVTLTAADMTVTVSDRQPPDNIVLFISSYLEGSGYNKFLEIYNKGTATANLDDFAFPNTANGHPDGHEHWNAFTSGATLGPGQHYIIAHPDADAAILDKADQTHKYLSNGNDAYALVYGTESEYSIIDSIGKFGPDPGDGWDVCGVTDATKDHALLRKPTLEKGNGGLWDASRGTNADDCEWYVLSKDEFRLDSFPLTISDDGLVSDKPMVVTIPEMRASQSDYLGKYVEVEGVVTGVVTNSWVFIQAVTTADQHEGLMLYLPNPRPMQGNLVKVTGVLSDYYGVLQMAEAHLSVVTPVADVPSPIQIKTGGENYEHFEGMLVAVEDVEVTDSNPDADDAGTDYGEFSVSDGSGDLRVDDASRHISHDPKGGEQYSSITGILHYSFGNYKILPRTDDDLILEGSEPQTSPAQAGVDVIVIVAVVVAVVAVCAAAVMAKLYMDAKKKHVTESNVEEGASGNVVLGRPVSEEQAGEGATTGATAGNQKL